MSEHLTAIVGFTTIPVLATLLAGIAATLGEIGPRIRSLVQHFAAGVVFSAAAGEILPEIKRHHDAVDLVIGFGLGVVAMLAVQALSRRLGGGHGTGEGKAEEEEHGASESGGGRSPVSMLATSAIDVLLDGIILGIAFGVGEKAGILLTIALTLELVFLSLAVSTSLQKREISKRKRLGAVGFLAALLMAGSIAGGLLQAVLPERGQTVVLSFGLAALLFLVVEELLVEAHEVPETPITTACFFVGFLAITVIGVLT